MDDASINAIDDEWGWALIRLGKRLPAERLIKVACACAGRSDNDDADKEMVEELGELGEYIVDQLLMLLSQNSENDQSDRNNEESENHDEDDDHEGIAHAVIEALLELDHYASVDVLQTFLQHTDETVRDGARKALAKL
jgi:hypothetical protein